MSSSTTVTRGERLSRRLGFWSSVGIVIGITIGSGIFRTPAAIAARVPSAPLILAVWALGGILSLCGALSVAELAATFPATGGWYVYLREGWGRLAAFLFGWSELVLIRASATGAIATVFGEYLMRSLGYDPAAAGMPVRYIAAAAIAGTAAINIRGVRMGAMVTGLSTAGKFGALTLVVLLSLVMGHAAGASVRNLTAAAPVMTGQFGLALISVLWAYDGFGDVSFVAGEVVDPGRNLPRAIVSGTVAVVAIYIAANVAYLYVNAIDGVARSPLIAADTMRVIFGPIGVTFVSIVVAVSTLGALNAIMLSAPRIFFAMAEDGLFFRPLAAVHQRYGTPYVAILMAAGLGVLFVMTRTFQQLADTFVLSIWPFYAVAIAGLYRLRRRRDLQRPYRVPGYPFVPAIFIVAAIYLVGNALVADPVWTGVTFGIILAGMPVYYVAFAAKATKTNSTTKATKYTK